MLLSGRSCQVAGWSGRSCYTQPFQPYRLGGSRPGRWAVRVSAAVIPLPKTVSTVQPKGDLVLVKVAEAEDKTTGGVLLPTSSQMKPTSGDVVGVGDGRTGKVDRTFTTKVGDTVLYSKFGIGATDIAVQDQEHVLIREDDLIGVLPRSGATAADVPHLKPLGDRVLLKVQKQADVTTGGVLLPDSAKERPMAGTVVRTGPGKLSEKTGERAAPKVKEGDQVLYFKYAGDSMETPSGEMFIVVHESDILCKV